MKPECNIYNIKSLNVDNAINLLISLQEFVDYYEDFKYVLNDELREMIERAESAINKATE